MTAAPASAAVGRGAGRRAWAALWVLAAALGMIVLDGTIVSVALPAIMADLHLDLSDAQWVNSLYSVVFASLLLTWGRVGDRRGRRRLLLVGLALFVLGSVLAALSGGIGSLLLARTVQGIGGAMVLPATLSTVNAMFQGKDRAVAFGVWGSVMSGAAALGPLLGGALTEVGNWTLIFWVNVPIGIGVLLAAMRLVPESRDPSAGDQGLDLVGSVLSALGFGLIVFGLIEAGSLGWWQPTGALTLFGMTWPATATVSAVPVALALGAMSLVAFAAWELSCKRANRPTLVEPALLRITTFVSGNVTAMLVAVGEFALLFVLPLYLVTSMGLSTLSAGVVLAAMAGGAFLSGAGARLLASAIGVTGVVLLGLGLEAAGAAVTAILIPATPAPWVIALALLPYGLGLGLASAQLTSTVLRDVPTKHSGAASATQSTVRQLGAALGSAIGGTVLAAALSGGHVAGSDPHAFAVATATAVWVAVGILATATLTALRLRASATGAVAG